MNRDPNFIPSFAPRGKKESYFSAAQRHVERGGNSLVGDVTLDEGANFTFNGTSPQVTSTLLPTTVNDLTADNEEGVTLSQETTINGTLLITAGVFDWLWPEAAGALDGLGL